MMKTLYRLHSTALPSPGGWALSLDTLQEVPIGKDWKVFVDSYKAGCTLFYVLGPSSAGNDLYVISSEVFKTLFVPHLERVTVLSLDRHAWCTIHSDVMGEVPCYVPTELLGEPLEAILWARTTVEVLYNDRATGCRIETTHKDLPTGLIERFRKRETHPPEYWVASW